MKNILFYFIGCIALFTSRVNAQETEQQAGFETIKEAIANRAHIFAKLEKERIPYGILLDKAIELKDITLYNGRIRENDSLLVNSDAFYQVTTTLSMAKISEKEEIRVPIENVSDVVQKFDKKENEVLLGGVYYKYAVLKENLQEGELREEGGQLYDSYSHGVWQNPYEVKESFVLTPMQQHITVGEQMAVVLPKELWYSNMDEQITGIEIDNGEGFRPLKKGEPLYLTIKEAGVYDWVLRMKLRDGTILQNKTKIVVLPTTIVDNGCEGRMREIRFRGNKPYNGKVTEAVVEIWYANDNCTMRKPLIVAEGYDAGFSKDKKEFGDASISTFLDDAYNANNDLYFKMKEFDIVYRASLKTHIININI